MLKHHLGLDQAGCSFQGPQCWSPSAELCSPLAAFSLGRSDSKSKPSSPLHAVAQTLPYFSLGNSNTVVLSKGLISIPKHYPESCRKKREFSPNYIQSVPLLLPYCSTREVTFHIPRDIHMLFLCSGSPETEFEVCLSQSQKHKNHNTQLQVWENSWRSAERSVATGFYIEWINCHSEHRSEEKPNEFCVVGGFSLKFSTLGYHSITHYIIQPFHYVFILQAIHSFNINIHESQNQLYMILSMIFLINTLKNVNYPLNISNTGWMKHSTCICLRVQTHKYTHNVKKYLQSK